MADTIGAGVIEIRGDATRLKASIDEAKRSIASLGKGQQDISKSASASIDRYVNSIRVQNATLGKSAREVELFKLAFRGANEAQLRAADAALRFRESHEASLRVITGLKVGMLGVATAALAAGAAVVSVSKLADGIGKLSQRTGIGTEALSALRYQAELSDVSFEELQTGLRKFQTNLSDAAGGSKEALAAFKALGISQDEVKANLGNTDKAFKLVADRMAGFADGATKSALAVDIFGKTGDRLIPLFNEGAEGIQRAADQLARFGGLIGPDLAAKAQILNDNMTRLKFSFEAASITIGGPLIGKLAELTSELVKGREIFGSWSSALINLGSINPFKNYQENIRSINVDIEKMLANQGRALSQGRTGAAAAFDPAIGVAKKQVEFLKFQALQDALKLANDPSTFDARDLRRLQGQVVKPQAPVIPKGPEAPKAAPIDTSRQDAAALLAFDIDAIRKASQERIGILENSERIMQALRSAGRLNEREHFDARIASIHLLGQEQERAARAEIERLSRDTFTGKDAEKDRLDTARKIAAAEAKIGEIRIDAAVKARIAGIEHEEVLERITKGYEDAEQAARAYIATISREAQRELQGIGRGTQFRETLAGLNPIEDRAIAERERVRNELEPLLIRGDISQEAFDKRLAIVERTFKREVEIYEERTEAIRRAEADWINGANEALQNYVDMTKNVAKQVEDAFGNAFRGLEDFLLKPTREGLKRLDEMIVTDINRILIRQNVTGPLAKTVQENLPAIGDFFGIKRPEGIAGAAAGAAGQGAALTTQIATAGTAFSGTVTTAATTIGTQLSTSATAFGTQVSTAATSFFSQITSAASAFAARIAIKPPNVTGGDDDLIGALLNASFDGLATGGLVRGPGTSTSDSIPAMLSNREFVVRAEKVAQPGALPFLRTMNERGIDAAVAKIASGGRALNVTMHAASPVIGLDVRTATAADAPQRVIEALTMGAAPSAVTPFVGSYERGIAFVPKTGLAMLHQGERVVPKEENRKDGDTHITINQSFAPGTDKHTIDYAAAEMERRLSLRQRGMSVA